MSVMRAVMISDWMSYCSQMRRTSCDRLKAAVASSASEQFVTPAMVKGQLVT